MPPEIGTAVSPPPSLSPPQPLICSHEAELGRLNEAIVEIKDTLKDLKDLLSSNAALTERMDMAKSTILNIDTRLRKLEVSVAQHQGSGKWLERIVWCLVSLALGAFLGGVAGRY